MTSILTGQGLKRFAPKRGLTPFRTPRRERGCLNCQSLQGEAESKLNENQNSSNMNLYGWPQLQGNNNSKQDSISITGSSSLLNGSPSSHISLYDIRLKCSHSPNLTSLFYCKLICCSRFEIGWPPPSLYFQMPGSGFTRGFSSMHNSRHKLMGQLKKGQVCTAITLKPHYGI